MNPMHYLLQLKSATQRCTKPVQPLVTKKLSRWVMLAFLFLVYQPCTVLAQQPVLTLDNVFTIVRNYHPIAKQAGLSVDSARAGRLAARGAFDPLLYVTNQQKTFDGKNYYFYTNPELKIPTWYGVDVKAGLEDNGGDRLINEATAGRSSYVGVSIPFLKNLLTDKRRTTLEQAKIMIRQNEAARLNELNNLLYDAASAYYTWLQDYQVYNVIKNVITINEQRLQLVRQSFMGGDRAAIDTVEALTQLQSFQFLASEAQYRWIASGLELSNFLWLENEQPYQLNTDIVPDTSLVALNVMQYPVPALPDVLLQAQANHPKIQTFDRKLEALQAERRLKFQSLLPALNFNYNFLNKGYEPWKGLGQNLFENNYKYGIEFGLPLFLRQGRGDYKIAKIKITTTDLQKNQAALEIENKIRTYYNQLLALRQQVKIYEDAVGNYSRLLQAEGVKFSIGESSLFLLNSRENKVLEAKQKMLELKTKFFKVLVALQWAEGSLASAKRY